MESSKEDLISYRIFQGGVQVARVDGPIERAYNEINHYAHVYQSEGALEVQYKEQGKRWKKLYTLSAHISCSSNSVPLCGA